MFILLFSLISSLWYEDWTNAGIDELLLRAQDRTPVFTGTSPIGKGEFNFLSNISPTDVCGVWLKQRLETILENYEKYEYSIGVISDSSNTRSAILFGKGIGAGWATIFIEPIIKFKASPEYPSRLWQDFVVADYLRGYVKLAGFGTALTLGRETIKWGPSPRKSLVISGNAPPFDLVRLSYKNPKLKFTFFGTQLNPISLSYKDVQINRYFTGHRLEYALSNSLNIGVSEVALFGGENKTPDLYYFNPVVIYYPYQWHHKSEVNILCGMDFKWLVRNMAFYGELMVDDFPYEQSEKGEHPKIGVNIGAQCAVGKNYILAEYTAVTRWTYDHLVPWQQYTYMGYGIGNPYGPDFDELFVGIIHHLSKKIDVLFDVSAVCKGSGTIDEPYPAKFDEEYWLTGNLKNIYKPQLGIQLNKKISTTLKIGCIINDNKTYPTFSVFFNSPGKIGL